MIAYIKGILQKKSTSAIIINNGGIGYEVITPLSTFYALPEEEKDVSLHVYTHVREDALMLFGFLTELEKTVFRLLISVSGIGPRLGINILSGIGPEELLDAISSGDVARLQSIPGIGKKTAERLALELKDKALKARAGREIQPGIISEPRGRGIFDDALSALVNLGYPSKAANSAVEKACSIVKDMTLEGVIKEALRLLV
ncbi:MAG: Holliday junction branch migration protein RuvA [Deltaproteobacteria bacterium]|nr:Holliday junction branch migration protein RuvA [Deltaproteobacteria bacterium]